MLSYNSNGELTRTRKIHHGTPNGPMLNNDDYFGSSITNVGDLTGNGNTVLAVGARADDAGATDAGAIYLLSFNANGVLIGTEKVYHSTSGFVGGGDR